jgi:hypothetical protein
VSPIDVPHTAPPVMVAAPVREASRFGLFSVATIVPTPELRWQNGVEWEGAACDPAGSVSGVCFDPSALDPGGEGEGEGDEAPGWPPVPRGGEVTTRALPFAVYGSYDCSAFSRPLAEAEIRARAHLGLWEETEVERVVTVGDRAAGPSFQGAVDLTPGGGASITDGFGLLEAYLAENLAGIGAIHMPRGAGARAADRSLLNRVGQRLETPLGNYVAAGGGYDVASVGPDGSATPAGSAWLYATSVPTIRRGEVFVIPDEEFRPKTTNNDVTIFAVRVYVVGWDCVTAAVLVDITEGA